MRRAALAFLAELVLLGVLVAGFLAAYTGPFGAPTSSVLPHLQMVGGFVAALCALRILLHLLLRRRGPALAASALLVAGFSLILCGYYALVLVGMMSWGRVVSWQLIATYVPQLHDLLGVLGIHPALAAATAMALVLAAFALARAWLVRADWPLWVARHASLTACVLLCACGLGMAGVQVFLLATEPPAAQQEPLSLTVRPDLGARMLQNHAGGGNAVADARDREARETYAPVLLEQRPNVILVVGDALRGDHMGVLGYARDTTPWLSSLDQPGRMSKARMMRSVCGESSCGLMAIAASSYLHTLGARPFTLAEVLKRHGYRIGMILGGDHTNFYNLREAYGPVDSYFDGSMVEQGYMNDDRLVMEHAAQLQPWDGQPVFLQFHLMSTHGGGRRFEPERYLPARNYYFKAGTIGSRQHIGDGEAANYYDNGVLQFDAVLRRLVETLGSRGYLQDAILVVAGDHGEMLGENGEYTHARSVAEGALSIPMVMLGFGRTLEAAHEYPHLSSQVDIGPTLLAEIGIPAPASWHGLPLQRDRLHAYVDFMQGQRVGTYEIEPDGRAWKYWRDLYRGTEHLSRVEPAKESELAPADVPAERTARLRARIAAAVATVLPGSE